MARKSKSQEPEILVESVEKPVPEVKVRVRNEVQVEPRMKFSTWFLVKLQDDARLKPHHSEALRAFMVSLGLGNEEPGRRFDSALRSYFGS